MNDIEKMREIARAREERMFNERSVMKATWDSSAKATLREMARKLFAKKMPFDFVTEMTDLPESEIRQIQQEL
ncbi:MAG: hypothetical protein LBM87_07465 [Ruminococcus sp.]|jgi:hypothetical protein|nr:hypothetical protein [Ruminococcus sp.]